MTTTPESTEKWIEGEAFMLKQKGFSLMEPALFLRFYPRGTCQSLELAVFVRTGDVCPPSEWAASSRVIPSLFEYKSILSRWSKGNRRRQSDVPGLEAALADILEWQKWREDWITSGKLYEEYDDDNTFDIDDPFKSDVIEHPALTRDMFLNSTDIIVGNLNKLNPQVAQAFSAGPIEILKLSQEKSWGLRTAKKLIPDLKTDFAAALDKTGEGMWMNLCLRKSVLSSLGVPQTFLKCDGYWKYPVPNYDQLILQCDGIDKARTLGMHRDVFPGCSAAPVSTLLGCVGGKGKEILIWRGPQAMLPLWWTQEGLPCELFDFVYSRTSSDFVQRVLIKEGQFVFMPKGLWHWVRPLPKTEWTAMVTCSFHSIGQEFQVKDRLQSHKY